MSAVPSSTWPWPASLAPQWLGQSFNNGWTFGNVIVTTQNSRAPGVERDIVSRHSYGRQIGKLMDAVVALAQKLDLEQSPKVKPLCDLARDIEVIKSRAQRTRMEELHEELKTLKRMDPRAWRTLMQSVDSTSS